jgi:endonuclease YncB( thermonuclease family)
VTTYGPYPGVVTDWHDGDTCHINLSLGFSVYLYGHDLDGKPSMSCRIWGIDSPELSTTAGPIALAYAEQICPPGSKVTVLSHGFDKFGARFDGTITLSDGRDFGAAMIAAGQAVAYEGGAR